MSAKKAWGKGTKKEKIYQITSFVEQKDYESALNAISGMKLCTAAIIADRVKCGLSVAKKCIAIALSKGMITPVICNGSLKLYTTTSKKEDKKEETQANTKKGKK